MYYSESDIAKPTLEEWYNDKIASNVNYSNIVASGNYFCEEAKVAYSNSYTTNSGANMEIYDSYMPNFTCEKNGKDGNGKGYVSGSVGFISYDEVAHAGGYYNVENDSYYLYNNTTFWTMSPAGFSSGSDAFEWRVNSAGNIRISYVNDTYRLRPVINLKADTYVSGNGTSALPYTVITDKKYIPRNLNESVLADNTLIEDEPDLTTSSNNTTDVSGLYVSTLTNDGSPTYYFRGNVENNYVDFAGFIWRIVRVNEDSTVRLIMQDAANNDTTYQYSSYYDNVKYMYYSNGIIKSQLDNWYVNSIDKKYVDLVATGEYFCEQAKVALSDSYATNSGTSMVVYTNYEPNFKCKDDENGYGLVNHNIGLINYDEIVYAGGFYNLVNEDYYIYNNSIPYWWTMSPGGFSDTHSTVWYLYSDGGVRNYYGVNSTRYLRPVINLKTDTIIMGLGTSNSPYKVQ